MNLFPKAVILHKWYNVLFVALISVGIGFGSYAYYRSEERVIHTNKQNELSAIAKIKVTQIEQWIKERMSEAEYFSTSIDIKRNITALQANQNINFSQEMLTMTLSGIRKNHGYENILIVDRQYNRLFELNSDSLKIDDNTLNLVDLAFNEHKILSPTIYYCKCHKKIHIDILAPILNSKGKPTAVIIFRIDPNIYLYPLIQSWPLPSKTAENLVVARNKDSVIFLNTVRHRANTALKFQIPISKTEVPSVQAVMGNQGVFEGIDYRGKKVLSFLSPINGVNWYMVTKIDKDEIYAELHYRAFAVILFGTLIILIIGLSLAWAYHYRQRNIYQNLFITEKSFREKEAEYKTTLYSIGEGVITTDLNGHITQMNKVAETLTGYSEKEAIGKPLSLIFNIVNGKSRNAEENPVQRVLQTGNVVGISNHTILIAKDGHETPILDSASPIKNKFGETLGVVLVFRNIKEEYELQEALRKSEERLRITLEEMQIGVWDWDIETDKWYASSIYHTILGYSAQEGPLDRDKWIAIIHPEDREMVSEKIRMVLRNESKNYQYEARILNAEGNYKWISVSGHVIEYSALGKAARMIGVRIDITQRKKEEEELRISEERFRNVFEHASVGKSITSIDGKMTPNNAFAQMLGYEKEELSALNWKTITHPDDVEYNETLLKNLFAGDDASARFEKRYLHKNGSIVWVDITTNIMRDNQNNPLYLISTILDITESKRIVQELKNNEAQLHTLVQTIPDLIWLKDKDGIYLACNWIFERFFGAKEHEIVGKTDFDFIEKDIADFFRENDKIAMAAGGPKTNEEWVTFADDGHKALLETTKTPMLDSNGNLIGVLGIARDITAKNRAEQEHFRLLNIIEQSINEIYIFDFETLKFEYANQGAIQNIGYKLDELQQLTPIDIKPLLTLSKFKTMLQPLADNRVKQLIFETIHRRKNGTTYPVEVHLQLHEQNGKRSLLAIINDVSQKKKSEQALYESRQLFEMLALVSPVGIFRTRIDGYTTYVNPTWSTISGLSYNEAIGLNWLKAVHPDDRNKVKQGWENAVQTHEKSGAEYRFLHPNGSIVWVIGSAVPEFRGEEIVGYIGTLTDITSRKEAEEALAKSEAQFRALFENVGEGIAIANTDEMFEFANPAAEKIFGVGHNGLTNLSLKRFVSETTYKFILEETEKRKQNVKSVYEVEIIRDDGEIRYLLISAVPNYRSNGEFAGTFGVFRDITEQKAAESVIHRLNESLELRVKERTTQLEAANKELESFSYSVSHDLRAPLRHINGFINILLNTYQSKLPEEAQHYLQNITFSTKQMGILIDDILKLSRTGRMEMVRKEFSMDMVVAKAIDQVMQTPTKQAIEWRINPLPDAFADENLLLLVWINLIDNAVKYTRNVNPAIIEIGIINNATETIYYIRDNGVGFDMKYAKNLFGVFQRLHTDAEFEGTGIGLANVNRIITRHGGKIWAEAELGKGATFFFALSATTTS